MLAVFRQNTAAFLRQKMQIEKILFSIGMPL